MVDRVATVRRSPDGQHHAFLRDQGAYGWLVEPPFQADDDGSTTTHYHLKNSMGEDWEVVYQPPFDHGVGTVMRREGTLWGTKTPFWEVAVRTERGWHILDQQGGDLLSDEPPYDDNEGAWKVIA